MPRLEESFQPGGNDFTGYRPDIEDREEILKGSAPYQRLLSSQEWRELDLFSWWRVRNQASKGSCRGHSLAANGKLCYFINAGLPDLDQDGKPNEENLQDDFSPDWCYYRCQKYDNIRGDNGATIAAGVKVGMNEGLVREVDLPYEVSYQPGRASDSLLPKASPFKFGRYSELSTAEELFDWVGSGQGGIDWGTVWPLPFTEGCLVKGLSRNTRGGGHATAGGTLLRGATVKKLVPSLANELTDDEWVLQCMNSHSSSAQFKGFYFVTMEGCQQILRHEWTTAIGWSDMSTPEVRPFNFVKKSVFQ